MTKEGLEEVGSVKDLDFYSRCSERFRARQCPNLDCVFKSTLGIMQKERRGAE